MTDINFYHLTKLPMEKALPKLLSKVLDHGQRSLVVANDEGMLDHLDSVLWTFSTKTFLPHGSKKDPFPGEQPIYLTTGEENPNGATVLVLVGGSNVTTLDPFDKCLYMFDGTNDHMVDVARKNWKLYKELEHSLIYWQQDDNGRWQKGAQSGE